MNAVINCFGQLAQCVNAFIPPVLFYPVCFFVGVLAFIKIFRSVE